MQNRLIKDLSLNEELDSKEMAAIVGGKMNPITATHNLTTYNTMPLHNIAVPSLGGELLDDTSDDGDDRLNPAGV